MTQEFSIEEQFTSLDRSYAEIDALLALPGDVARRAVEGVSGWSVEQHIAHLSLANELVARNLRSLLKGAGPFVVDSGEPPAEALAVLAAGKFPRGRAQAPRIVRPPEAVNREYLSEWLAGNRSDFSELRRRDLEFAACAKKVPHQVLGPLSAAQWLRFAATHTLHHLEIAREILASAR